MCCRTGSATATRRWRKPWQGLIALIEPHYPKGEGGRPAYPLMAMLRVHLLQNWFGYSDPAMEE
ncbi:transposase, partial [Pseudomonas aeruginosa]|uniref:transposase n=1 Tax=Pseudomonas aeruginosa TaxID=287 RepID=UPI003D768F38